MNAKAVGRKTNVDGQDVFYVESLELLGANILFSDKATFRKTKLQNHPIAAASNSIPSEESIQSESESITNSFQEPGGKMNPIEVQLQAMSTTLTRMEEQQSRAIEGLEHQVAQIQAEMATLQTERQRQIEEVQASQKAAFQEQQESALLEKIGALIDNKIQKDRNPSGQPPRRTTPLVASAAPVVNGGIADLERQIIATQAKLDVLRQSPSGDRAQRIALAQELNTLKAQAQSQSY